MNFRKIFISRIGITLTFTTCLYVGFAVMTVHSNDPVAIIFSLVGGLIGGNVFFERFQKDQGYFLEKIEQNETSTTRQYRQLLKKGAMPAKKSECADYLKYLDALESSYARSTRASTTWFIPVFALINLSLWPKHGITWINILGIAALILMIYVYLHAKRTLPKIR